MENKAKARCQVENKAMKTKLTNMLRGKERKKRKNRYAKSKQSNKNKVQQIDPTNKGNERSYLPVKSKTNQHKLENKTKARYKVVNKTMKIKLTNTLRGKERKKEQICKVKQSQMEKIYIH